LPRKRRKIIKRVLGALGAAAFFYYWLNDSDPNAHTILGVVVLFEVAIEATDQLFDYFEDRESNQMEAKLDATHKMAVSLSEGRSMSESQRLAWKLALSRFAPQRFVMIQIGYNDFEAAFFARQVCDVLMECGWQGVLYPRLVAGNPRLVFNGITVHGNYQEWDQWNPALAEAIGELLNQIRTCGIIMGGCSIPAELMEKDMVGIAVGGKP